MKKMTTILMSTLLLGVGFVQTGCFGEFALTRQLYSWNQGIGNDDIGGRFVRTLIFYGLSIIPVYGFCVMADFIVLNLIEFWSGSNPIGMKDGEKEEQIISYHGNNYKVIATKNQFEIIQLTGADKGKTTQLVFDPQNYTWTMNDENGSKKLVQFKGNDAVFFTPNGEISQPVNNIQLPADMAMAK